MIKILVVDDEPKSCENIQILLNRYFKSIPMQVSKAYTLQDARDFLNENTPDIVFLDINLPDGRGLDLVDIINPENSYIIIISAYDNYAMDAYRLKIMSYILKPIDIDDFNTAIARTFKFIQLEKNITIEKFQSTDFHDDFTHRFKEVVLQNIESESLDIEFIASSLSISTRTLNNRCNNFFLMTPTESIHHFRLEQAKQFLNNSNFNISEIAYKCGYNCLSYFSRLFKSKYGITPSQFKRTLDSNE